jgi:hypothetical protein
MPNTAILGITELSENQSQAFSTVNEAIANLERATQRRATKTITSTTTTHTFTLDETFRNALIDVTNGSPAASGSPALIIPRYNEAAPVATSPKINRMLWIRNNTSLVMTVRIDGMSLGSALPLAVGEIALFHFNDQAVLKLLSTSNSAGSGHNFNLSLFVPGNWPVSGEVFRHIFTRSISFSDNFANSLGAVGGNPGATVSMNVLRGASTIGTISINTSGVFTFNTTGTGVEIFNAGDILSITSTGSDPSLLNVAISLAGNA